MLVRALRVRGLDGKCWGGKLEFAHGFICCILCFLIEAVACGLRFGFLGSFALFFSFFLGHDMGELVGHQFARFCGIIGMAFVWGCFGSTIFALFSRLGSNNGNLSLRISAVAGLDCIAAADLVCIMKTSAVSAKLSISVGKGSM